MSSILSRAALTLFAGILLGVVFALALGRVLAGAVQERTREELVVKLERLSGDFEEDLKAKSHPDKKVRVVARQAGSRVTLIATNGEVLADSEIEPGQLGTVENHATRPEIVAARRDGIGFDARRSATVREPFVYVARRAGPAENPDGFVRLAIAQADLDAAQAPFRTTLVQISTAAGILVGFLFLFVRHRQARELGRVREGVAEAAEGRQPNAPARMTEETEAVFFALSRFARLVAEEREGTAKARLLAQTVFEEVPVGLVVVDQGLAVLDANPAALHLFRAPAAGPRHALIDLVRDPDVLSLFSAGVERGTAPSPPASVTVRIAGDTSAEQVLEVTVRSVPHSTRAGEPAAVGVVRDVTDRERTESMRRRFVSDVSHELRTPIAAICAAVETLGGEPDLSSDLSRLVEIIARQSGEMQELVSDLTDLSQMESGAVTLNVEQMSVRPLLEAVIRDLTCAAEWRQVTVALDAPEELSIAGDHRRLSQVFRNLVDNAIKFSPAAARVDVLAEPLAFLAGRSSVAVHVVDRGIGIPRSEQAKIFQRFYRVDPSRAKTTPGTGLGLAIVKHLLILHGGSIQVESEPGKGSRFTVTLPAAVPQNVPKETPS
jgi:two-component system, OmpR family, phosphate regulon sensor histidine kinase PhoR